jgi:hypothetical protein
MRLIKLSAFRQTYFEPGSAPTVRTLHADYEAGDLPGVMLGGRLYVDLDALSNPVDHLVESVLQNVETASGQSIRPS